MSRQLFCKKLNKEASGLEHSPYPGPLGDRIYNEISQEAWSLWLKHQTLLINEHKLSMAKPESRQFLKTEMEKFFFGKGSDKPAGYKKN